MTYLIYQHILTLNLILDTTADVLAVLSDTTVMIITTYFAWKEAKQFREVFGNTQPSLTVVFVKQGKWVLAIAKADRAQRRFRDS